MNEPVNKLFSYTLNHKFTRYTALGLFLFLFGVGLNVLLVEAARLSKPISYTLVIICQVAIGFALNRSVVFESKKENWKLMFTQYVTAIGLFRGADWLFYLLQIEVMNIPYVVAQTVNGLLIFFSKYYFYRRIF